MPGVVMRTVAVSSRYGLPQARQASTDEMRLPPKTYYRTATVGGHAIFYREAGDPARPTIVLLHGFPSTSHEFRELIPLSSQDYHVVAPDYLGSPPRSQRRALHLRPPRRRDAGLPRRARPQALHALHDRFRRSSRVPPDGARPQGRRSHHRAECQLLSRRIDAGASDLLPPRP